MTGAPNPGDTRLTPACRAMLRSGGQPLADAVRRHAADCAFCAEWLRGRERLQSALREPVAPLSELRAAALLDGVRERLVEQCEEAPLGQAVADTFASETAARELAPHEAAVDSASIGDGDDGVAVDLSADLAERLRQAPGRGAAPEWREIRDAVFARPAAADAAPAAGAASGRSARARAGAMAAAGGLAAAALLYVVLVGDNLPRERDPGRRGPPPVEPEIVFADLTSLSGVEFSPMRAVRRGGGE